MTQISIVGILISVRTSFVTILFLTFIYTDSVYSFGGGRRSSQTSGISQDSRAASNQTYGGAQDCIDGSCGTPSLRADGPRRLPTNSALSGGVDRGLVNIYRSCDAGTPLRDLVTTGSDGNTNLSFNNEFRSAGIRTYDVSDNIGRRRSITNGAWATQYGPYYQYTQNGQCQDPSVNGRRVDADTTPVIFQNGASLQHTSAGISPYACLSSNGFCNMGPDSQPAIGLDCMEFVGLAMVSACLKFTTQDDFSRTNSQFLGSGQYLSNAALGRTLNSSTSCFNSVGQNSANFLQEGDMIFGTEDPNHAIIFTDVDPVDPLGIENVLSKSGRSCESITPRDFNFSLAQSTSLTSFGPSKVEAADYFCFINRNQHLNENKPCTAAGNYDVPFPFEDLVARAIQICRHREGRALPPSSMSSNYHFVRHKGTDACRMDENECPDVVGDECADDVCRMQRAGS